MLYGMKIPVIRHHFPVIDSTNTWAKQHIASFDRNALTIITAETQTGGRGRLGRKWVSPPGNLYVSFCFFWKGQNILNIPQLMALTIVQELERLGVQAKIKWPNDLLVDGQKIGGILCETIDLKGAKGVIIGVGLNIFLSKKESASIDQPNCTLASLGVEGVSAESLLESLIEGFNQALVKLKDAKDLYFLKSYKDRLVHSVGDPIKGGFFEDIDNDGYLLLRKSDNSIIRIASVIDE